MTTTAFENWLKTKLLTQNKTNKPLCSFICVSLMQSFQLTIFKLLGNQGLYKRHPISNYNKQLLSILTNINNSLNKQSSDKTNQQSKPSKPTIQKIQKIEVLSPNRGWILTNILTRNECQLIMNTCENYNFEISESYNFFYNGRYCDRIESNDKLLSNYIYQKIKHLIPNKNGFCIDGLNTLWRFCKYDARFINNHDLKFDKKNIEYHRFEKHIDGGYLDTNINGRKSYLTIMIYLNNGNGNDFKGGNTVFYKGDRNESSTSDVTVRYKVVPKEGMGIMFWQYEKDLLHSGEAVYDGVKYMMRTDIMYQLVDHRFCLSCSSECEARYHNHNLC